MDKPANTRISCRWRQNSGQVLYAVSVFSFNHLICLLCHMQFSSSACVRHREYYLKNLCRFALFLLRSGSKISLVRGFSRSFSWARVQETLTQMSKFVEHAPIALLPISAVRRANPEQIVEPHLCKYMERCMKSLSALRYTDLCMFCRNICACVRRRIQEVHSLFLKTSNFKCLQGNP